MTSKGPPLTALQAFVAVAQSGSVREAARRLGVGHSVIARHLKTLQDWSRKRLVETGVTGTQLTPEGQAMFAEAGPAFAAIERIGESFRPMADRAPLTLWCAPGLASRWLMPRLDCLGAALGDRPIQVRPTETPPDFQPGDAGAAIIYSVDEPTDGEICSIRLCTPAFFPVASPSWLALNQLPPMPDDLASAPLIHEQSDDQWRAWLNAVGAQPVSALTGPRLWHASMALDAAEHSQGLALTNMLMARSAIEAGRLGVAAPLSARLGSYYLLAPRRGSRSPVIQRLRGWLTEQLADTDP